MAFDLSKLKPGDEVGIESDWSFANRRATTTIRAIHDDGVFELDGGDWFDQDGKCVWNPEHRHLAEPTNEGRLASLLESLQTDLDILGERARGMTLEQLKAFREVTLGLLANE